MSQSEGRIHARIAGTGSYLPEKVLTNADLAEFVETSDEWIVARTGIRERLQRLGAADLAAIDGDRRVERHVLRLERRNAHAAPGQYAADCRGEHRFPGVGSATLNHQTGRLGLLI